MPDISDAEERRRLFQEYTKMTPEQRAEKAKEVKQRVGTEIHDQMMSIMQAWNRACTMPLPDPENERQLFPILDNEVLSTFVQFTWDRFIEDPFHEEIMANPEDFYMNCLLCGMYVMYEFMADLILKMEE